MQCSIERGEAKVRFSKKNRAMQIIAVVCIAAILVPTIFMGFLMGWIWLLLLTALFLVPVIFIERRVDKA